MPALNLSEREGAGRILEFLTGRTIGVTPKWVHSIGPDAQRASVRGDCTG